MRKLGLSLLFCIAGMSAKAQYTSQPPFIYFNRLTMAKEAENGLIVKLKVAGYTIMSPDCTRSIQLLTLPDSNSFYVRTNNGMIPAVLVTKSQTQFGFYDVCSYQPDDIRILTISMSGVEGNFTNNGVLWAGCKTISFESHNMGPFGPENTAGTLSLDIPDTFAMGTSTISNGTNSITVDTAAGFLYTNLTTRSYFPIPDPLK